MTAKKSEEPVNTAPKICECAHELVGVRRRWHLVSDVRPIEGGRMRDYREPWLSLQGAADYWGCSVRSIQYAITDGMPHATVFGKPKVLASEAEPWLIENGRLTRGAASVTVGSAAKGAATDSTAPPHDREVKSRWQ